MLTKMTEEDWEIVLEVFDAAQSDPTLTVEAWLVRWQNHKALI
jgi:hypothetical protein